MWGYTARRDLHLSAPARHHRGGPVVNTLILRTVLRRSKPRSGIQQRSLSVPGHTQTIPRGLWDTYDVGHSLCDMRCTLASHKIGSATSATHNGRARPAAGHSGGRDANAEERGDERRGRRGGGDREGAGWGVRDTKRDP